MARRRHTLSTVTMVLAFCIALNGQTGKQSAQTKQESLPALSAQEIFKRVSPSVMVVESLDAEGKVTKFGSGVVIASGQVVTNRHVIEGGISFRVEHNGEKWAAKLIKVDPDHDLAELSVDGLNAPALQVRDSSKLAVGEKVYAIGAPEGLELTISEGLISGLREFDSGRVIQTSAAISPGSSGGGLIDAEGRLVGITTFYLKEGQSLNFALPAEWTLALSREPPSPLAGADQETAEFEELAWAMLGDSAYNAGKYDVASKAYKEVTRLKPGAYAAWEGLGSAEYHLAEYRNAISAFQEAIRLKPNAAKSWAGLGGAYSALGQYGKALGALQESVQLKPNDALAWYMLGLAYKLDGQQSHVLEVYGKLRTLDPNLAEKLFKEAVLP